MFQGVLSILVTPFLKNELIDETSLRAQVEFFINKGVDGVVALGVNGEAHKLTEAEKHHIVQIVLDQAGKRCLVFAGTGLSGTYATVQLSKEMASLGVQGVMIAPPAQLNGNRDGLIKHYLYLMEKVDLPIIVQDYPLFTGVQMDAELLVHLIQEMGPKHAIKLEDTPSAAKIKRIFEIVNERGYSTGIPILGGLGGMYLLEELMSGASGTMTGFAFPEILVEICQSFFQGNQKRADHVFELAKPLLDFEGQNGIGLAIRKEILRRRGVISDNQLREPFNKLSSDILQQTGEQLQKIEQKGWDLPWRD